MKSKKVAICIALVLAAAALYAAGGQQAGSAQAGGPVTLKWAMWDKDLTVYYQPLIDAYQAKNPSVKIELVDLGSADYQTMVLTQLTGGADLDIITVKDIPGYANLVR
jgi:multiple sugar transport system substrate-binding protein